MKFFGMKNAGKSCVLRFEEKKIDDDDNVNIDDI